MSLKALREMALDRAVDIEELVALSMEARAMVGEFLALDQPVPQWLEDAGNKVREEIVRRTKHEDFDEMRKLESQIESLKSPTTKMREAQERLAVLQRKHSLVSAAKR